MTDLDFCVAGVVWRDGPVSAYRVRERFRTSMTPAWSSSCGTIYPVIQRLLAAKIIAASDPVNRRGTQLLIMTPRGKKEVGAWINKITGDIAAPVPDPVRTRLQYVWVLPPAERAAFVDRSIEATEQALTKLEGSLPARAASDPLDYLAALGSVHQLRGRLSWLTSIRSAVIDPAGLGSAPLPA